MKRLFRVCLTALCLTAPCLMASTLAAAAVPPGVVLREIRDGLYWISDGAYNTMFLVSSAGVIAMDPLPTLGLRYLEAIRSVTDQPVTHVVYSHAHTDHIGGAALFPKAAVVIAQRRTAELLAQRADPRRPVPTVNIDDTYRLVVGEQVLELRSFGDNHSPGNLFIYAPRQKVLMLVDVVYPGYMPYPNLGVATDLPGYIDAHRQALAYAFTDFIGGHVDRIGTRADVEASLAFTLQLRDTAAALLREKPFPDWLKRQSGPPPTTSWFQHDDYERELTEQCYRTLQPAWAARLAGTERFLRSHCWTMIMGLAIDVPPP